ncbi:MAG: carboxypeptidase-like regulatory domain-containing protein [Candidatus Sulfotelmatobacter sp.]
MNSELDRASAHFAFCIAAVCTVLLLTPVALPVAQTTDSAQPSKSMLGQISGRVCRSDTGESIPKAEVELYPADPDTAKAAGAERIVRSGPDGTFVFIDLPAGSFGISVWRNGFVEVLPSEVEHGRFVTLRPGQRLDSVTLRLRPTGVIAGQISDEDREAVQGLEVMALRIKFQPGGRKQVSRFGRTVTDDLGNFRIANLPPGSYYVSAGGLIEHPMGASGLKQGPAGGMQYRNTFYPGTPAMDEAQVVKLGPEASANDIRFTVPTEGNYAITGKVISAEARPALKGAEVSCERVDAAVYTFGPVGDNVQVEADHSFKCSSLAPGDYRLKVKTVDTAGVEHELGFASVRVVDSNVNADIEIGRAAEVRGGVETPAGLSPEGKRITLETFWSGFHLLYQAPGIDAGGRFVITNIPPGEFTFTVSDAHGEESVYVKKAICGGRDYASRELTLAVGTSLDCDVTLANDTGTIQGKVTEGEKPARGRVVALIPESKELRRIPRCTLTARTDVAGQYKIAGVIPGEYLLFAVRPSADDAYFAVDFPEDHADIAEHVKVDPSTTQAVNLKSSKVEQ